MQGRDQLGGILLPQHALVDVLDHQELQPVQQLRSGGLLLQAGHLADVVEDPQGLRDQLLLDAGEVDLDDLFHGVVVGEADVVEEAAAQKGVRQFLLVVRGDDDHRADGGLDRLVGLVDEEFHAIELLQEVVRELDVGLVDLVDQQHGALGGLERLPELALLDVVAHVLHPLVAQLAVPQAGDGVVFVQTLMGLGGGLDVPGQQGGIEGLGHFIGQHGLAGAGLALDQQRPLQRDGGVHRHLQVAGRDVVFGPFKTQAHSAKSFKRRGRRETDDQRQP